jgi:hypothetical protein
MAGASDRHNLVRGRLAAILLGHVSQLYRDVEFEDPTLSSTAARATRGD